MDRKQMALTALDPIRTHRALQKIQNQTEREKSFERMLLAALSQMTAPERRKLLLTYEKELEDIEF